MTRASKACVWFGQVRFASKRIEATAQGPKGFVIFVDRKKNWIRKISNYPTLAEISADAPRAVGRLVASLRLLQTVGCTTQALTLNGSERRESEQLFSRSATVPAPQRFRTENLAWSALCLARYGINSQGSRTPAADVLGFSRKIVLPVWVCAVLSPPVSQAQAAGAIYLVR